MSEQQIERTLDEHERRLVHLESSIASDHEAVASVRGMLHQMGETVNQVSGRVTAVRDLISDYEHRVIEALKDHERREEAKWEEDHRYRESRERDDKRDRLTGVFSLLSILATLGAVLLAWALGGRI